MKKLLMILMCLIVLCWTPTALAEEAGQTAQAYDWAALGTIAGATAWTLLLVQFIKAPLDKVWKLPTRAVVYVIALATLVIAHVIMDGFSWSAVALDAINAVIVATSAMGMYEMTFKKMEGG